MDIETYVLLRRALPRHIVELIGGFLVEMPQKYSCRSGGMSIAGRIRDTNELRYMPNPAHMIMHTILFDVGPRPMDRMLMASDHPPMCLPKTKATAVDFGIPTRRQQTRERRAIWRRK